MHRGHVQELQWSGDLHRNDAVLGAPPTLSLSVPPQLPSFTASLINVLIKNAADSPAEGSRDFTNHITDMMLKKLLYSFQCIPAFWTL